MGRNAGFSLIELMIVVLIIGVLSGVAIPIYKKHIVDTKRGAAQAALLEIANILERQRIQRGGYAVIDLGDFHSVEGYTLSFDGVTSKHYKIIAKPVADQAGNGVLYVDEIGRRCWNKTSDTDTASCGTTW